MSENKTNAPAKNVLNQPISFTKKVNYPTKTRMNLYVDTQSQDTLAKTILAFILLAVALVAFAKFGVIDRLTALNDLRAQARELEETQSSEANTLASFTDIKESYYRSTGRHLSDEQKALRDRLEILSVLDNAVTLEGTITSYQISGNTAQVSVIAADLDKVAQITQTLRASDVVQSVNMNRADKNEATEDETGTVTASITVTFKAAGSDEAEGGN